MRRDGDPVAKQDGAQLSQNVLVPCGVDVSNLDRETAQDDKQDEDGEQDQDDELHMWYRTFAEKVLTEEELAEDELTK